MFVCVCVRVCTLLAWCIAQIDHIKLNDIEPTPPDSNDTRMRQYIHEGWRTSSFAFDDDGEIENDINASHRKHPERQDVLMNNSTVWQTVIGKVRRTACSDRWRVSMHKEYALLVNVLPLFVCVY